MLAAAILSAMASLSPRATSSATEGGGYASDAVAAAVAAALNALRSKKACSSAVWPCVWWGKAPLHDGCSAATHADCPCELATLPFPLSSLGANEGRRSSSSPGLVAVAGSDGPQPADLAFCITIRDRERLFEAVRQRLAEPELEGVLGAGRLLPLLVRRCGIIGSSTRVTTRVAALRALRRAALWRAALRRAVLR